MSASQSENLSIKRQLITTCGQTFTACMRLDTISNLSLDFICLL